MKSRTVILGSSVRPSLASDDVIPSIDHLSSPPRGGASIQCR